METGAFLQSEIQVMHSDSVRWTIYITRTFLRITKRIGLSRLNIAIRNGNKGLHTIDLIDGLNDKDARTTSKEGSQLLNRLIFLCSQGSRWSMEGFEVFLPLHLFLWEEHSISCIILFGGDVRKLKNNRCDHTIARAESKE